MPCCPEDQSSPVSHYYFVCKVNTSQLNNSLFLKSLEKSV